MSDTVIQVERLSKRYRLGLRKGELDTLRSALMNAAKGWVKGIIRKRRGSAQSHDKREHLWALKHVSFEVKRGEVLGVIGPNGAGKSTLLKILSRITEPTEGHAKIRGRVVSLLEVGTGFHPELTGRENVYLNAAILGMRKREIEKKFDEIVAFSGVEKFIDTPVKRYSSGMSVRLAFSVAAHVEPEIMIIDEVLAVGDMAFQKKCLQKMDQVRGAGRTILFVSHQMASLSSLCQRGVVLSHGVVSYSGNIQEAVNFYISQTSKKNNNKISLSDRKDRDGSGKTRFTEIGLINAKGESVDQIDIGGPIMFRVRYSSIGVRSFYSPRIVLDICNQFGVGIVRLDTEATGGLPENMPGSGDIACKVEHVALAPGSYNITAHFITQGGRDDHIQNALSFEVMPSDYFGSGKLVDTNWSPVFVRHSWEISS